MRIRLPVARAQELRRGELTAVPWLAALFVGLAALGAWFLIQPALGPGWYYRPGFGRTPHEYSQQLLLLFVPYGLALWAWHRGARAPLWVVLGGAVVLHVLVLFAPLPQSQDFYQYLFYGRMQAAYGANPMVVSPSAFTGDPWYVWIRWFTQPSVYGPAWTLASFAAARVAGDSLAVAFVTLKVVVLALDLAVMVMIVAAWRGRPAAARDGRRRGDGFGPHQGTGEGAAWGVLAYGWNPLVLVSVPLAGSADVALAAGFLGAYLARRRGRMALATAVLTLACLVKAYAAVALLLHLVLLARERGRPAAAAHLAGAAGLGALFYAPYWSGVETFRGLINATALINDGLVGMLRRVLAPALHLAGVASAETASDAVVRVVAGVLFLAVLLWAVRAVRDERRMWQATVAVLAAYLYLTPWFLYWYVVGPLALVAALPPSRLTYPVLAFSGSALIEVRAGWYALARTVQTVLRYGIPVALFALRTGEIRAPAGRRGAPPAVTAPPSRERLPAAG